MSDYETDTPKADETPAAYGKRLQADGQRELYIRKALRAHFGLEIEETIAICSKLPAARLLELKQLRGRFSDLNENRLAWKISKSLTLSKKEGLKWAHKIFVNEGKA